MRQDKAYIFTLRREGKSYREIQRETGVSRATLTSWFKDHEWSAHALVINESRARASSKERMDKMNEARKVKLVDYYDALESEAVAEYEHFKKEPLFWAGLMVYAGEGDIRSKHLIRVRNAQVYLHKVFIRFSERYLGVSRATIRCGLVIYPDANESLCKEMWSNLLDLPRENFYKTLLLKEGGRREQLQYGLGMSILSSTALKKKLIRWLQLAQDEKFAAMV